MASMGDHFSVKRGIWNVIDAELVRILDEYYNVDSERQKESITFEQKIKHQRKNNDKLKILYVTFLRYPNIGGLSNYITSLKGGMKKLGHEVDVISPVQMPPLYFEKHIPEVAVNIRDFLQKRYGIENEKIIKNMSYLHVFSTFLQEQKLEDYDLFHAEDLFAMFLLRSINRAYKRPLFFTPHGHFTKSRIKFGKIKEGSLEETYFSEIEKQGIRIADRIVTISKSFHLPLKEYGAKDEQLIKVHTGIDFSIASVEKKKESLILSSVARLAPRKGHHLLLQTLATMRDELANVEVWIVGDGVMRKQLEQEVVRLGLSNVTFFGKRTDVPEILACSTIYILPTLNDNFPISVIEAMFAGQAIITTSCGGIPEMIQHGETGLLCEAGNVEQLVQALRLLLVDNELRNKLGKQAQAYAKVHFTQANMVKKMERIYYSVFVP
jgi:glycosyltransferase involved in cell wall biosynthesis